MQPGSRETRQAEMRMELKLRRRRPVITVRTRIMSGSLIWACTKVTSGRHTSRL